LDPEPERTKATTAQDEVVAGTPSSGGATHLKVASDGGIKRALWVAGEQMRHFQVQMEEAEQRAGQSGFAYLEYMEARLDWMMRRDAKSSLEAGKCYRIPGGADSTGIPQDLFGGEPYLLFSAYEDGRATQVAVPMVDGPAIRDMQRMVRSMRWDLVRQYVDEFNAMSDAERASRRASCAGKGRVFPNLPKHVNDLTSHRLEWSLTGDYIFILDE